MISPGNARLFGIFLFNSIICLKITGKHEGIDTENSSLLIFQEQKFNLTHHLTELKKIS